MDDNKSAKAVTGLILLVLAIIFYIWFYSAGEASSGVIQSKWTESHTSCNDDGCTTSTSYLVQFNDGRVYDVFWGTRDWDRIIVGSHVSFDARGRDIRFFGWRIMQPSIFSFQVLESPPR